jgi:hypothetical protein
MIQNEALKGRHCCLSPPGQEEENSQEKKDSKRYQRKGIGGYSEPELLHQDVVYELLRSAPRTVPMRAEAVSSEEEERPRVTKDRSVRGDVEDDLLSVQQPSSWKTSGRVVESP